MQFQIDAIDSQSSARATTITTGNGSFKTPVFMPIGTTGGVKAVHFRELKDSIGAQIILGNTYHLYLRPGMEVMQEAGGLHGFNGWDRPLLTDSGGYQVFSLSDRRKITEKGVHFHSHIDGSKHLFSPEKVIDIQRIIGGDIIMAFDECLAWPSEHDAAKKSMELTHRWLNRCIARFQETESLYGYKQALFPIVQGSTFLDLRKQSAEVIAAADCEGNAIGGLSVGEPADQMYEMAAAVCEILPAGKPRYLMGVGMPDNILECIALGVDMFDCVIPTRNGRNGMIFTTEGIINIRNKRWEKDFSPLDYLDNFASKGYSKAFLRHLLMQNEILGCQVASVHNLSFYLWLVNEARQRIIAGDFVAWKNRMVKQLMVRR
ncbi:MAG: tRNA guanosine(34) transglycosylase Tgt [Chitinophagales bacterium]|nr:tRNA guanosine(34) transglycosylase Tgt [Chitinophagales bacterium]